MDLHPYWHRQTTDKPLYPDIEWSKPEQRTLRGRLGIIGGNKLGFAGVAEAYTTALQNGAGEVRVLLPDILKKTIPRTMSDVVYGATTISGGLAKEATDDMLALGAWSSAILFVGDAGRNSETAIAYEDMLRKWDGVAVITRDAVDLIKNAPEFIVSRPQTTLVISFAQLQKLFQMVYYPKVLTFSMQLMQLVEAVHKFTLTYPVTLVVLHKDTLIVAHGGEVTTTPWDNAMLIWRGVLAAKIATYLMWTPSNPLESTTTSVLA